jgi:hypothetical protein
VSNLVDIRVIGAPEVAAQAVARLGELLDLDRLNGPHPSRKTPELVRCYLTGRLHTPEGSAAAPPGDQVERVVEAARALARHVNTHPGWGPRPLRPLPDHLPPIELVEVPQELIVKLTAAVELLDAAASDALGAEGGARR